MGRGSGPSLSGVGPSAVRRAVTFGRGFPAVFILAIGTIRYLLGLLHELLRLYGLLYNDKLKKDKKSLYEQKLQIISHSLYGVDIDRFATNIAMLRLWLSLAIEADDPIALPHLEFKIETGDAVLGPDPQAMPGLQDHFLIEKADKLIELKDRYLRSQGREAAALFAQIEAEQSELAFKLRGLRGEGVIDWRIQFAEVFVKNHGFDVVLANPPYVRQELIKDVKPELKRAFPEDYSGTADLYVYFYLRALQLLAPGGMLAFISSNKWFRAKYGLGLRRRFAKSAAARVILDFHDLPVFETAVAYPMVFIASKSKPDPKHPAVLVEPTSLNAPYPDIRRVVERWGKTLSRSALAESGEWYLAGAGNSDILAAIRRAEVPLGEFVKGRIFYGIKTGFNDAFVVDRATRDQLIDEHRPSRDILQPFVRGR